MTARSMPPRAIRALIATVYLVLLGFAAVPASAQTTTTTAPALPLRVVSVDTSLYPKIRIVVAPPTEMAGAPIPASAFNLAEDGEKRRATAQALSNTGLDVVLAIDTSGSMSGAAIDAAKSAATAFVAQMPPGTRIAVVGFGTAPYVVSDFNGSPERQGAIAGLRANGETSLYDALLESDKLLADSPAGARKTIVVLSDGGDTRSVNPIGAVSTQVAQDGTRIYAVGLATPETDLNSLNRLTSETGGRFALATDPTALVGLYRSIATDLSNEYAVEYSAKSREQSTVTLTIDQNGQRAQANIPLDLTQAAAAVPIRAPADPPSVASAPGFFQRPWTITLGAIAVMVAIGLGIWVLLQPKEEVRRLAVEDGIVPQVGTKERLSNVTGTVSDATNRMLERRGRDLTIEDNLARAGVDLTPGQWTLRIAGSVILAFLLGFVVGQLILAVLAALATYAGFRIWLSFRTTKRRKQFAEQLGDTLQLLASSLRAGHSFMQAIDALAHEATPPTSDEFRRLVVETRLGRPVTDSLDGIADRVGNEDFSWVVQAVDIHREVGGDLADLLDRVAATIRDRARVQRQVQTLSAEGRLSAMILFGLPFVVAAMVQITNPGYFGELTGTLTGRVMIGIGIVLLTIGGFWMRRLIRRIAY
jgi:tight adherence protein B